MAQESQQGVDSETWKAAKDEAQRLFSPAAPNQMRTRYVAMLQLLFDQHESDRGFVIFCAALIEELLESLLRSILRKDREGGKVVESLFRVYAPFSTFSAKIQVSYALNLLPEKLYRQLLMVKKLRNDFAHDDMAVSFESPKYRSQIEAIMESFRGGVQFNHLPKFRHLGERFAKRIAFCFCMSEVFERLEGAEEVAAVRYRFIIAKKGDSDSLRTK